MLKGCREPISNLHRIDSRFWKSGSLLECSSTLDENKDVRSYTFIDPDGGSFKHKAGQHISVLLPLDTGEEYRTFTIATSPTTPDSITLTIKTNRPDGATAWMSDNIEVGTELHAVGPVGLFNIEDYPCEELLLVSAGSGITPMMSMLRWLSDRKDNLKITFIHYAKTSDEYLFSDELNEIETNYKALNFHQISTHREDGVVFGKPSIDQISSLIKISNQMVFCCGPKGFMDVVKSILLESGLEEARYHQESFGGEISQGSVEESNENTEKVSICYKNKIIEAPKGSNLLSTLQRNKVVIPTGCKSGMCGTCQMKIESGSVNMNHQGGLSEAQVDKGYILACCSTLENNLTIV